MTLRCPLPRCGAENGFDVETCAGCGTPLRGHARLAAHGALLFNQGLAAAREGNLTAARDLFAAVVHWCPLDMEARNALALASFQLDDVDEARRQWELVRERRPADRLATQGLGMLAAE
jgi:Flp pilus assembly protein TadD